MIKKTIILFICLFSVWTIYLMFINKDMRFVQHQWQDNMVEAQGFIYSPKEDIHSVIIGTSLSKRIEDSHLEGVYNLSFAGKSATDGINILLREDLGNVRTVFIETNILPATSDNTLLDNLYSPVPYHLKKNIISFRDDKQFLSMLGHYAEEMGSTAYFSFRDRLEMIIKGEAPDRKQASKDTITVEERIDATIDVTKDTTGYEADPGVDMEFFNKLVDDLYTDYSKPYTSKEIDKMAENFEAFKQLVTELEAKGIKVVFFEMPINNRLSMTEKRNFQREMVKKYFPATKYDYIELPYNYKTYFSTDGLHLTYPEGWRYTNYFKKEINKFQHYN